MDCLFIIVSSHFILFVVIEDFLKLRVPAERLARAARSG
jgi:hypothetical protein